MRTGQSVDHAFVGIDVAFARNKRLPVAVSRWIGGRLVPEPLRDLPLAPPRGHGNAGTLDDRLVETFADEVALYLDQVSGVLGVRLAAIAIDAPSAPCRPGLHRRAAEVAMDGAGISCFATPTAAKFDRIREKAKAHLQADGQLSRLPHSNQLWMLVGFALFRRLRRVAPCLEVFPQATVRVLGGGKTHKFNRGGVASQLDLVAEHTGWPCGGSTDPGFEQIGSGPAHDRLDAYLSAWVAALEPQDRIAFGEPPDDAIWTPRPKVSTARQPVRGTIESAKPNRSLGVHLDAGVRRERGRVCPGCGTFVFKKWPLGWDAHSAYRCQGLKAQDPESRKAEFRSRFGNLFISSAT